MTKQGSSWLSKMRPHVPLQPFQPNHVTQIRRQCLVKGLIGRRKVKLAYSDVAPELNAAISLQDTSSQLVKKVQSMGYGIWPSLLM